MDRSGLLTSPVSVSEGESLFGPSCSTLTGCSQSIRLFRGKARHTADHCFASASMSWEAASHPADEAGPAETCSTITLRIF